MAEPSFAYLCASAVLAIHRYNSNQVVNSNHTSFLVIQTAFLGDVILATAVLEALHMAYPDARLDVVVKKGCAALFKDHPYVEKVFTLDKEHKLSNLPKLISQIRAHTYSRLINIHRHGSSGIISAGAKAKEKVGFKVHPFSMVYTKRIAHQLPQLEYEHEVERNYRLIEDLPGVVFANPKLYPFTAPIMLNELERPYITISPGSVWKTKRLASQKWVELIHAIPEEVTVYLLGSKAEKEMCDDIVEAVSRAQVHNKAGEWNLLDSAQIMQEALLNYVLDSAPLHLCSAMNAPVVAVFVSTSTIFGYGPLSEEQTVVQTPHLLDCRPCGDHGRASCPKLHFRCGDVSIDDLLGPLLTAMEKKITNE